MSGVRRMLRLGTTPRRSDGQAQARRAAAGGEGGGAPEAPGGDGAAEAQWSRTRRRGARDVPVSPDRSAGAELVPDSGGCEDGLWDDLEDDDDSWDELDDDLEDDLDDEPGPLEALQDRIRAVVAETVERRDPEVARRVRRGDAPRRGPPVVGATGP